ncbi:BTB/POZ domain-containing protein 3-like [Ostrea edulis]|uniref:BTB/POZ domain-containing protein 3-like n=1 Tax=Ostrea edulis TaxID=37623 RepID=UPI0024AF3434|nr:BTB/POZ domain-containing protein 3-like [Ostrea edulis]
MAGIFGPQWRREKTPLQCLTYLCLSETLADVHFTFTDGGKPLPGHKFVLAMRSEEFEQMFYTEIPQPEILIEGTSKETFQMLLRYIYTNETNLNESNTLPLIELGGKYKLDDLVDRCVRYLESSLCSKNACATLDIAFKFDMKDIKDTTLRFIQRNAKAVFKSEGFKSISREALECIMKSNVTSVLEIEMFSAAAKWAEVECGRQRIPVDGANKRQVLGDLLYDIRITQISLKSYSNVVIPSEILTEEEQLQLYKYFTITGGSKLKCKLPPFERKPRQKVKPELVSILKKTDIKRSHQRERVNRSVSLPTPKEILG